jgi:drug/metabolite transporter (DMT)-like permease
MHNTLLVAILAGLGGMIGWGAADFFAKKTVDRVEPLKGLVWGHSFGTAIFAGLAAVQVLILGRSLTMPQDVAAWLGLIGFGVLQMVIYWLLYIGFKKGRLAVLNPIFASFTGIVALIAILFLGEPVQPLLVIGLAAIFGGILLLNVDLKGLRSRKLNVTPGLKEVGAATVLAAIWTLGWDRFVGGQDSLSYAMWMYAFMTLAALIMARSLKVGLSGIKDGGLWLWLVLIGAGEALAYLAVSWGYGATSRTGVVALISGAFSLPTVVLAYLFLKERITRLQTAAILVIIAGIVIVSIG